MIQNARILQVMW